jgi:hypothetical protein
MQRYRCVLFLFLLVIPGGTCHGSVDLWDPGMPDGVVSCVLMGHDSMMYGIASPVCVLVIACSVVSLIY